LCFCHYNGVDQICLAGWHHENVKRENQQIQQSICVGPYVVPWRIEKLVELLVEVTDKNRKFDPGSIAFEIGFVQVKHFDSHLGLWC
jgi:hypothetical protein